MHVNVVEVPIYRDITTTANCEVFEHEIPILKLIYAGKVRTDGIRKVHDEAGPLTRDVSPNEEYARLKQKYKFQPGSQRPYVEIAYGSAEGLARELEARSGVKRKAA